MTNNAPLSSPALVLYWLKDGGSGKFPAPPLSDVANYSPLPTVVNLFAANLALLPDGSLGLSIPDTIQAAIQEAQALQQQGVKVVLSVFNGDNNLGWSTLNALQSKQLALFLRNFLKETGLDGIDIDDEGVYEGSPGQFYQTVDIIRTVLPNIVISNAVYDYQDMAKYQQYPALIGLMTYCSTMAYSNSFKSIIGCVQQFNDIGIPLSKLCAGVQAGPTDNACDNHQFTSIATSVQVAQWARTNAMGVMLFTFSQDVVAFTDCPQNPQHYPTPQDHAWQKAIAAALYPATSPNEAP